MQQHIVAFLAQPVSGTLGQPLRVAIYSRIAEGIRARVFVPGAALPNEIELGEHLGVSRTVVREALMLLEEDGRIVTRRGIGRFVATEQPRIGLEQLRSLERVLATADTPVSVRRVTAEIQTATDFSAGALGIARGTRTWFFESVLTRGADKIALVQEYLPADEALFKLSPALATGLPSRKKDASTVLDLVITTLGQKLSRSAFDITVGTVGAVRGRLLGLRPADPILLMNQTISIGDKPLYLAKHVVSAKAGHLSVMQTPSWG
jgi:GntR family transcriptional regulator